MIHNTYNKKWRNNFFVVMFLALFIALPTLALAAARTLPFTIGETLDPGTAAEPCGPTDANCFPSLANSTSTNATTTNSLFAGSIGSGMLTVGTSTASSTIYGNSTSTFHGINLTTGCLTYNGGACITSGAGSAAVGGTGAVQFANGAAFAGDASNFFWDDTNNRLGIGSSTPYGKLSIDSTATTSGAELITNGTFDVGSASWTLGDCASWGSGVVTVTWTACSSTVIGTTIETVAGRTYLLTFKLASVSGAGVQYYFDNNGENFDFGPFTNGTTTVAFTTDFTGTETISIAIFNGIAGGTWKVDNVSVKEVVGIIPAVQAIGFNGDLALSIGADILGNSFVGLSAGKSNTSGYSNTAYGNRALFSDTTGSRNTANGYHALLSNTTGSLNTAVGVNALLFNTSGTNNTAHGYGALSYNSSGTFNTAIGTNALGGNTTGISNTASGVNALLLNVTGGSNTANGLYALGTNITGSTNAGFGAYALYNNLSATNTTAVGTYAAQGLAGYNNQGGVYVGYQSGYRAGNGSNYNTFLGYQAGYSNTTGSHNITLGQNVDVPFVTRSQQLNIGNILYGTGIYNGATVSSAPATSSLLAIGTSTPWAKFSIMNANASLTPLLDVASSTNASGSATSSLFRVNANGNVGVGTSTPWRTLSVQGTLAFNGLTTLGATGDALCIVAGGEIERNVGAATCTFSSRRFKENIDYTNATSALAMVLQLRPAAYNYIGSDEPRLGLIAEDVEQVENRLVARSASGTPQSVRYEELTSVLAGAVQAVNEHVNRLELFTLATTTSNASGTPTLLGGLLEHMKSWLADASNGIGTIIARVFVAKEVYTERLCVGTPGNETCVTKEQLDMLLRNSVASTQALTVEPPPLPPPAPIESVESITSSSPETATTTEQTDILLEATSTPAVEPETKPEAELETNNASTTKNESEIP